MCGRPEISRGGPAALRPSAVGVRLPRLPASGWPGFQLPAIGCRAAATGPAAADIARSLLLLTPRGDPGRGVPATLIELADRFRALYVDAVLLAVGLSASDVDVWRLPVTAGRLSEGIAHQTESLVLAVRQLLR